MDFQDISEDILRLIFGFCNISTVLALYQTNKYLHRLSLEKIVWVDLVDNLRCRGFVDQLSLSDIQSQSQEALVGLVRGLMSGPASWTAPTTPASIMPKKSFMSRFKYKPAVREPPSQGRAQISKEFHLHPSATDASPELLGGGEYVLFNSRGTFECWSVRYDKLVWEYEKNRPDSYVIQFGAEVLDGGDQANIIVCERYQASGGEEQSLVQIVNLDFHTGTSTILFSHIYLESSSGFLDAQICGNMACLVWQGYLGGEIFPKRHCLLIDWQRMLHLKLAGNTYELSLVINLLPHHLLVLTKPLPGIAEISLLDATIFSHHWRQITHHSFFDMVYTSDIEAIVHESITFGPRAQSWNYQSKFELRAYESVLEEGTYRVWIHFSGYEYDRRHSHAVACSYILSLPNAKTRCGIR
ncbi:hypothetical protein B0H11DRAFT_2055758 [Mycena galericulata]|nr:hypothetical protein B0H11DRAFT_2055758 [Mycena galericulata]